MIIYTLNLLEVLVNLDFYQNMINLQDVLIKIAIKFKSFSDISMLEKGKSKSHTCELSLIVRETP